MKYYALPLLVLLILLSSVCLAKDWLTVYNDNLALVRSQFDLQLTKGAQFYNYDQITSQINSASVMVKPLKGNVTVAEQDYEYDLAGTEAILDKYINSTLTLTTKNNSLYVGKMQFFDGSMIGLIDETTKKLILIKRDEIQQIQLAEMPVNFYTRPTLRWRLLANSASTFPMEITYLTGGLSWDVTYNATWDGKTLGLNSWVTINNQSGKAFDNVDLKLIAGDVNQVRNIMSQQMGREDMYMEKAYAPAPAFQEKAFHDFHMYTLNEQVSFADKQIKQLQLFPFKDVTAGTGYEYQTFTDAVLSKIRFTNIAKYGLGIPLPKGVFMIYKEDTDKNLEFIGEDEIDHTGVNEDVSLTTGAAFDLVGKTITKSSSNLGNNTTENNIEVTLRNNSRENKTIRVLHPRNPYGTIYTENLDHTVSTDNKYVWEKTLKPDTEYVLTFTERIKY